MTASFPLNVLGDVAPAGTGLAPKSAAHHGAPTPHGSAFHDALGRALAQRGSHGGAGGPGTPPKAADHPIATGADPVTALLRAGGTPDASSSHEADEARSGRQAHHSRPPRRGVQGAAERAVDDASESNAEAAAASVSGAAVAAALHAQREISLRSPAAKATSTSARVAGAKEAGGHAPDLDATSRDKLQQRNAAGQASAVKSALDAAAPAGATPAAARGNSAAFHPARPAREREKPGERQDAAKSEAPAAASRPEVAIPTTLDPRATALRSSSTSPAAPFTSAAEAPRAALPPSPGGDVQGALLRNAAHLKVDAGAMGALELHLRVREGALHLRVEGDAASTIQARAGELSRALAGDGLKLAPIEAASRDTLSRDPGTPQGNTGGGRGFEERREAWNEAADSGGTAAAAPPPRPSRSAAPSSGSSGVHVKA